MQLGRADIARRANSADRLAPAYGFAALNQQLVGMRISCNRAALMAQKQKIAKAAQLVAGVDYNAAVCRAKRRAARSRDIDPVILQASGFGAKVGNNNAAHRPKQTADCPAIDWSRQRIGWRWRWRRHGGKLRGREMNG